MACCAKRKIGRRSFMALAGMGLAATSCARHRYPPVPEGEDIHIGFIGTGHRGRYILSELMRFKKLRIVALCDVRQDQLDEATALAEQRYGQGAITRYGHHEDLLARDDLHGVVIASCDHWHVLHAIAAAERGLGIYMEKPMGARLNEAKALRSVLHRTGVPFQLGVQQRSDVQFLRAVMLARNGCLGEIRGGLAWCPPSKGGAPEEQTAPPSGLDYDRWLGPAPAVPYTRDRETNKWWWHISDYAAGFILGWGIHPIDIVHWGLGDAVRVPLRITGTAAYATGVCDCATRWDITAELEKGPVIRFRSTEEATPWARQYGLKPEHGTVFIGDRGWVAVCRSGITASPVSLLELPLESLPVQIPLRRNHLKNYLEALRGREEPIAPVNDTITGEFFCHACDIAMREGGGLVWDPGTEQFRDAPRANARCGRENRSPWQLPSV